MEHRQLLTKILALAGTILLWLPILAPLVFGVAHLLRARRFLVDYLMPAELFLVVVAGGLSLIAASVMARAYRRLIILSFAGAVLFLAAAMALAVVSGLASGDIEPQGIWWALTVTGLVLYIVGVIVTGMGGILLLRRLFGSARRISPAAL